MSAQRPSASTTAHASGLPRTALRMVSGGRGPATGTTADHLAAQTHEVLETLEGTVARLALAHRSSAPGRKGQAMDEEAFAWVLQSLEDISATLRGLTLGRTEDDAPVEAGLHAKCGSA
ncbi:hypothetical protein MN0502_30060 [Arthrobacter sp. MN05-02]|nr:hypothetical protein MN0502_30060 [Arthrobacter sp. MN05-02]